MAAGTKHDGGKPRPSLVLGTMSRAIRAVINVAEHGAQKYSPDGWVTVPDGINRYTDAMLRHLVAEQAGEAKDADSGLLHAAHAAWGALARLDLMIRKAEQVEDYRIRGPKTWHATPDGGVRPAGASPASHDYAADALRYMFRVDPGVMASPHGWPSLSPAAGYCPEDSEAVKRDLLQVQDKRDAMRALGEAGLLNTAFREANAAASLKLDPTLQWSEQLARWLRHYSHTFRRYEAEGLLRAEYASNTESLRVVGVAKRRYDGILAVIHDLPTDGTAVGGVEALGLAVDRAVAHWDELATKSKTKLGGVAFSERVGRRADGPHYGSFSEWAQQVEAKVRAETRGASSIAIQLRTKLRALSPLFVRLEAERQLVATYDLTDQHLTVVGVEGGLYDGFKVGMRNVNPGASNFDASMRNLARTMGQELFTIDQRRADQAQREFEQRRVEQAERERRETAQREEALLRRHHIAATNPVRICRAKLKYLLSSASLPVTRRLEQLRRADRLRVELQGGDLRLLVCDPNGAVLVCLNQVIELGRPLLHALEDATVAAFNRVLAVPRLESLITPTVPFNPRLR